MNAPSIRLPRDWSRWTQEGRRPWSVQIAEDVMVVDPERGVLASLSHDAMRAFGPVLAAHSALEFRGSVVKLTTSPRETVAEAVAEATLLRSELRRALDSGFGLAPAAAGMHPWSEAPEPPSIAPLRPRAKTEVAGILGRFDPTCGLRVAVTVPDGDAAVHALDGLRLQVPLLLALAANSPFWRGRNTGLASTRTALRLSSCHGGLPRSFGSYAAYVSALDALVQSGAAPGPAAVDWDARLRPELAAVEVTVMDSQSRVSEIAGLSALVQCLTRLHAERHRADPHALPELVQANRTAALEKGMRAELIDSAGHFTQSAVSELGLLVEACAPVARELACSRELAGVRRNATDPGYARQRSIAAASGLDELMRELVCDFAAVPVPAATAIA